MYNLPFHAAVNINLNFLVHYQIIGLLVLHFSFGNFFHLYFSFSFGKTKQKGYTIYDGTKTTLTCSSNNGQNICYCSYSIVPI